MKIRTTILLVVAVVLMAALAACQPIQDDREAGGKIMTLYVGPELQECVGVAPMECMLVKEDPEGEYELFYSQIEGFTFEPGYEYELLVMVEDVANAPADASSKKYTLVEIVNQTPAAGGAMAASLEGLTWELESYANADGEMTEVLPDAPVTASFVDGNVSGSAGCNRYFASYTVDGASLTVGAVGTTVMMCPEPIMAQESAYLAALSAAASYQIVDGKLEIADADGNVLLIFHVQEPTTLTGVTWYAVSVNNGRGAVQGLVAGTEITALFGEDGSLSGSAGCNNYSAQYTTDGDAISIGPAAMTMMMCVDPEGVMEQEMAYVTALSNATVYAIQGNALELRDSGGALQASFSTTPLE
jgi:heat shock protein HslJ